MRLHLRKPNWFHVSAKPLLSDILVEPGRWNRQDVPKRLTPRNSPEVHESNVNCGENLKFYMFSLVHHFLYFNIITLFCPLHYFTHNFIHNFLLHYLLLHPPLRFTLHYHSLPFVKLVLYSCSGQILAPTVTDLQQKLPRWCSSKERFTRVWCGEIMSWAVRGSKEQIKAEVHTRIDKQIYNRALHNLCPAPRVISVHRSKLNALEGDQFW